MLHITNSSTSAITPETLEIYENNDISWFDANDEEISCVSEGVSDLPGGDNLVKIYNFFLAKGASKQAAAAITGSIWQESKGNPNLIQGGGSTTDPSTVGRYSDGSLFENKSGQSSVGKAWGIIQWDPGNAALYWQKQAGVSGDIAKLETQLAVTWWHLNNRAPTSRSNVLAEIEAAQSLDSAVEIMSKRFFGCGKCMNQNRINAAKRALGYEVDPSVAEKVQSEQVNQYCTNEQNGTSGNDAPDVPVSPNASGYSRPIANYKLNLTCTVQTCHHDKTAAFDLSVSQGTTVHAIYDGAIYSNKPYGPGGQCRSIQFKGDDGWIYWYGHTYTSHSPGKTFKSGEVIGVVGNAACGGGSSHLHIDRGSPKGRTGGEDRHRDNGFIKLMQGIYAGK